MLRTRLATAVLAIPALWLIVQHLPLWLFAGFIVAVAVVALLEYFAMALPERPVERAVGVVGGLAVAMAMVSQRPAALGAALALTLIVALTVSLLRPGDLHGAAQRTGLVVLGMLYFGFLTPHAVLLRAGDHGWQWVLFAIFGAMGSDSGGYFAGRAFGRRKLAPAVSPSKTVEGALGAIGGAMVVALLARWLLLPFLGGGEALVLATIVSVFAQLGDLCESALKRSFGAKDSGWIIPGHGGMLDRLDSVLFPLVFTYYYAALPRV